MPLATETELPAEGIDEFLSRAETGVLSFARDGEPYSIPISYGYDREKRSFYLRLVSRPGSEKREFLSTAPTARLVVYAATNNESTYWSVVAAGPLEERDSGSLSPDEIAQYGDARRPLFEIWGEGRDELDIQLYELQPDELSGRRTDVDW